MLSWREKKRANLCASTLDEVSIKTDAYRPGIPGHVIAKISIFQLNPALSPLPARELPITSKEQGISRLRSVSSSHTSHYVTKKTSTPYAFESPGSMSKSATDSRDQNMRKPWQLNRIIRIKEAPSRLQPISVSFSWLDLVIFQNKDTKSPIVLRGQLQLDVPTLFYIARFSISLRDILQKQHRMCE